jgi:TetR/AcrR family transcriptional regulator, acrAB operon repressor
MQPRCTPDVKRTAADAELTRIRIVEAALTAFSRSGFRSTTIEDVAVAAGVTRGAVYWYYEDKAALITDAIERIKWPLDIGVAQSDFEQHADPLELLGTKFTQQIDACMGSREQWLCMRVLLRHGVRSELPAAVVSHIERAIARSVSRLSSIAAIARSRGHLRGDATPADFAACLHAIGIGILSEHANDVAHAHPKMTHLCVQLFLDGARAPVRHFCP